MGSYGGGCKDGRTTHGRAYSRAYGIWGLMRQRCTNQNAANYMRYGGRGIRCCESWKYFANFLRDMGEPPDDTYTLDRIDNDGDYTPENCRWASVEEQQNNRRDSVFLEAFGKRMTLAQWTREENISIDVLRHRIYNMKMPPEQALRAPRMWSKRQVWRTLPDGSDPQLFDSVADAARASGVIKGSLWAYLKRGRGHVFSGYLWGYANPE